MVYVQESYPVYFVLTAFKVKTKNGWFKKKKIKIKQVAVVFGSVCALFCKIFVFF